MPVALVLSALALFSSAAPMTLAAQQEHAATAAARVPASIVAEHEELHVALGVLTALAGRTVQMAREVERVLAPHFKKEEEYALPLLGLLRPLASGKLTEEMRSTAQLATRLKSELPRMLAEHQTIVKALEDLALAARSERQELALQFVGKLKLHSQNEEEVLYPAAILVGEYVALKH